MDTPGGEEREKKPKRLFEELITENTPNFGKEIAIPVHETKRTPNYLNTFPKIDIIRSKKKPKVKSKIT